MMQRFATALWKRNQAPQVDRGAGTFGPRPLIAAGLLALALYTPTAGAQVAAPQTAPAPAQQSPAAAAPAPQEAPSGIALHLENTDLLQVIGIIAEQLQLNYVVDPQVKGTVNVNTLGDLRREDLFPLLQMILRVNGATAVQTGNLVRITLLQNVQRIPLEPSLDQSAAAVSPDDRVVMNIIPLRYVSAADMTRILTPFLSEGGALFSHDAGNVLIITDSSRSMKRLLELVAQFDTEAFTNQRARLYAVQGSEAKTVAKEMEQVFAAYGLSGGTSAIRFVPIERINSILVVTANPSVYEEVERWLQRLDQPTVGAGVRTFIYKVENGRAEDIANVLSQVFLGAAPRSATTTSAGMPSTTAGSMAQGGQGTAAPQAVAAPMAIFSGPAQGQGEESHIRIVPDPVNNQLVIQATAQEYEEMRRTLQDLDIVPRQVMIEAKVYEVDLTGALSAGVSAFLQNRDATGTGGPTLQGGERKLQGSFALPAGGGPAGIAASIGTLVGKTRELLLFLNAAETHNQARVISAPSLLASDNIAANINVGTEVPILTSQALVGGAQVSGSSLFTNTIQNRDTGVLLTVTPRINSSGLVNLQIQQEVSAPLPPTTAGIQSPSIQKRSISTQVVVQDGETLALGGIIQESKSISKNRVPLLGDIPYVGALFGNTSTSSQRTELIVLLTPTVIRNSFEAERATTELRDKLKDVRKLLLEEQEQKAEEEKKHQAAAAASGG